MSSMIIETAFGWLYDHFECAGTQRSLTHGDLRLHNALVDGEDLVAILDWKLAAVNNPAFDLSYAYQDVTQLVEWSEFYALMRLPAAWFLRRKRLISI